MKNIAAFRETVYEHYRQHGRAFPWRELSDPYHVLVSEVMLQQTQAGRVVPKYLAFIKRWPGVSDLAKARTRQVLEAWQGLGYNRRALMLHQTAKKVVADYDGCLPTNEMELVKLPGIGPYTASAVAAFAGNQPAVVLETNIRSVFIRHFFADREGVSDAEIIPLVEATVDKENPREWYQALMDYGAHLKKSGINPSRRSAHYIKQSKFEGSDRQIRGKVIKALLNQKELSLTSLSQTVTCSQQRLGSIIKELEKDGFLVQKGNGFALA